MLVPEHAPFLSATQIPEDEAGDQHAPEQKMITKARVVGGGGIRIVFKNDLERVLGWSWERIIVLVLVLKSMQFSIY